MDMSRPLVGQPRLSDLSNILRHRWLHKENGCELLLKGANKKGSRHMTNEELMAAVHANAPIIATGVKWTKDALKKVGQFRSNIADDSHATHLICQQYVYGHGIYDDSCRPGGQLYDRCP